MSAIYVHDIVAPAGEWLPRNSMTKLEWDRVYSGMIYSAFGANDPSFDNLRLMLRVGTVEPYGGLFMVDIKCMDDQYSRIHMIPVWEVGRDIFNDGIEYRLHNWVSDGSPIKTGMYLRSKQKSSPIANDRRIREVIQDFLDSM